jgi:hypothetical protein
MPRQPKTTLWMLMKVVLKKRYVRVEKTENGRHIPVVEGPYEPDNYYLRYTLNGKREWESVGGDLTIALQELKARQASLQFVPSASVATLPTCKAVRTATRNAVREIESGFWTYSPAGGTRPTLTNIPVKIFRRSRNTWRRRVGSPALNTICFAVL